MILYKYRHCSDKTDAIFKDQKVWLAKSNTLNDPCECSMHDLSPDWVSEKVREMKVAQMSGAVAFPSSLPPAFLKAIKATLPSIENFDAKYDAFRKLYEEQFHVRLSDPDLTFSQLDEQLNSIGVFSTASTSDHPLMWSHYAQDHKGICLGFEVRDLTPSADPEHFLKVRYSDEIPSMGTGGFINQITFSISEKAEIVSEGRISLSDETLRAAISTKASCWSYEEEWRYIESKGGCLYPLPGPLVEIVFGFRCSPEDRTRYMGLAATHLNNDLRLYEIRRVPNSFKFERVFLGICSSTKDASAMKPRFLSAFDETSVADTHPLIQVMIEQDQNTRALPALDKALEEAPNSARLWRTKGVALGRMNRDEEALLCFERAIALFPAFFSAWYQRGVALTNLRRLDDAILSYDEAHKLNPSDGSTLYNMACVYEALGKLDKAKEYFVAAELARHPRARESLRDIEVREQNPKEKEKR